MMEGIGFLAKILKSTFQEHLLRSLYYVVELMGSSYSIVSNEGEFKCFLCKLFNQVLHS